MKKDLITQLLDADVQVAAAGSFSEGCSSLRKLKVLRDQNAAE